MSVSHRVEVQGTTGRVECGAVVDGSGRLERVELEAGTGVPDAPCKLSWEEFCKVVDGLVEVKALWKRKHVDPQVAISNLFCSHSNTTRDTRAE